MRKTVIGPDIGSDLELFEGVDGVDGLPHAEAVAIDHPNHRQVVLSGTGAIDESGSVVAPGDAAGQLEHILETVTEILHLVDGHPRDVIRMQLITEALGEEEYLDVCRVRADYMVEGHEAASTMIESPNVGLPAMRLEVDLEAVVPTEGWDQVSQLHR